MELMWNSNQLLPPSLPSPLHLQQSVHKSSVFKDTYSFATEPDPAWNLNTDPGTDPAFFYSTVQYTLPNIFIYIFYFYNSWAGKKSSGLETIVP